MGRVLIASSYIADPDTDKIWLDDKAIISNSYGGIIAFGKPTPFGNPANLVGDVDITSLLHVGTNLLTINLIDVNGGAIGCSSLCLLQVNSPIQPYDNYRDLNDFYDKCTKELGRDPIKDLKDFCSDFPGPIPNSFEGGESFRGTFKNNLPGFLLGYWVDINIMVWSQMS